MPVYEYDQVPWKVWELLKDYKHYWINFYDDISTDDLVAGDVGSNEVRLPYPEDLKYSDKIMSIRAFRVRIEFSLLKKPAYAMHSATVENALSQWFRVAFHAFDIDEVLIADWDAVGDEPGRDEQKTALEVYDGMYAGPSQEADFTPALPVKHHLDVLVVFKKDYDFPINPVMDITFDHFVVTTEVLKEAENWWVKPYYKEKDFSKNALASYYSIIRQEI